jgi:hypothetical protein
MSERGLRLLVAKVQEHALARERMKRERQVRFMHVSSSSYDMHVSSSSYDMHVSSSSGAFHGLRRIPREHPPLPL